MNQASVTDEQGLEQRRSQSSGIQEVPRQEEERGGEKVRERRQRQRERQRMHYRRRHTQDKETDRHCHENSG